MKLEVFVEPYISDGHCTGQVLAPPTVYSYFNDVLQTRSRK